MEESYPYIVVFHSDGNFYVVNPTSRFKKRDRLKWVRMYYEAREEWTLKIVPVDNKDKIPNKRLVIKIPEPDNCVFVVELGHGKYYIHECDNGSWIVGIHETIVSDGSLTGEFMEILESMIEKNEDDTLVLYDTRKEAEEEALRQVSLKNDEDNCNKWVLNYCIFNMVWDDRLLDIAEYPQILNSL